MSTKFQLDNGKIVSGSRFFFVGDARTVRVVGREDVMVGRRNSGRGGEFDCSPMIDPPFGAILLIPGSEKGTIWIEYYTREGTFFRVVEDWWPVKSTGMTRNYAREVLEEELATFGEDARWSDNAPNLIGAEEAPASRQARYEARRRAAGMKTVSVRLDKEARNALDRIAAEHGGDQSAAIREMLKK